MPPRIFISSVVDGYQEHRAAARRGIELAGAEPVLVNEDFPALAHSPRTACLDAVASCDAFIQILGARAGHVAASGRTVVEEEYEEALRHELRVLVFLEEGAEREARQQSFVDRVSGYIDGRYRVSFTTPEDLLEEVRRAVEQLDLRVNQDEQQAATAAGELLQESLFVVGQRPSLRTAFVPLRIEEVVDPETLENRLGRIILEAGHRRGVELLSYSSAYRTEVSGNALRVLPSQQGRVAEPHSVAAIEMAESGRLLIETNVTDLVARGRHSAALAIVEEDVEVQLRRTFALATAIYEEIDPYRRQDTFAYNTGMFNVGYQTMIPRRQLDRATAMRITGGSEMIAHPEPRRISRRTLGRPDDEIARTITRVRRAMRV